MIILQHKTFAKATLLYLFLFSMVSSVSNLNAQSYTTFERTYGTSGDDIAHASCITASGDFIVAGSSTGFEANGNSDFYIVKFDKEGHVIWSQHINELGDEIAYAVSEDVNGEILVGGITHTNPADANTDMLTARLDSSGNIIWQKSMATPDIETIHGLTILPSGNIFLCGGIEISGNNNFDGLIVITDDSGNVVTTKTYSLSADEEFTDLVRTSDSAIMLCSSSSNGSDKIIWAVKTDFAGDTLLTWQYDYTYNNLITTCVTELENHDFAFGGYQQPVSGYDKSFMHIVDSAGNFISHVASSLIADGATDMAPLWGGGAIYTTDYYNFIPHYTVAWIDTSDAVSINHKNFMDAPYWAFNSAVISNYSKSILRYPFDPNASAYFISGSSYLGNYGGLDFAITKTNDALTTQCEIDLPVISSSASIACYGDSVMLNVDSNAKTFTRWVRETNVIDYNLGSGDSIYITQPGVYFALSFNTDSFIWISNYVVIDFADTVPPLITLTGDSDFCAASGQTLLLTASNSTGASFQWQLDGTDIAGATQDTFTPTASGNYTCEMTNTCGSFTSLPVSVNISSAPVAQLISYSGVYQSWCNGPTYFPSLEVQNPQPNTIYNWYQNGTNIGTGTIFPGSGDGAFYIVASNVCGVDSSFDANYTSVAPPAPQLSNTIVCPGDSVLITSPAAGFGTTLQWYLNGFPIPGVLGDSFYASVSGNYACDFFVPNCSISPITSSEISLAPGVAVPDSVVISATSLSLCDQSLITLNATYFPNVNYTWYKDGSAFSNGTTIVTTQPGAFYCEATTSCGSINSDTVVITGANLLINILAANNQIGICSNDSVLLYVDSIQNGYSYQWYLDGNIIAGAIDSLYYAAAPGEFTVEVTQGACTGLSNSVAVLQSNLSSTFSANNVSCYGNCNGFIITNAVGGILPYSYQWSNGETNANILNSCAGIYTCTITDSVGCINSFTTTITEPPQIIVSVSLTPPTPGQCNGQAVINVTGGSPPYSITYNPPVPMTGFCENIYYQYTVTDSISCTYVDTIYFGNDNDSVWPGDANYDLIVDNYDVMPVGFYFGESGYPRMSFSNTWMPYAAINWGSPLQYNLNDRKHGDCNGDGIINNDDTLAVNLNYGSSNGGSHQLITNPSGPDLYFITADSVYTNGQNVAIEVWTGTVSLPLNNLLGFGFQMQIPPNIIEPGTFICFVSNNWIGNNSNSFELVRTNVLTGQADATVMKKDGSSKSGFGKIADINFTVNNNMTTAEMLQLTVLNYYALNADGDSIFMNLITDSILVGSPNAILQHDLSNEISVYPNPANDILFISGMNLKNISVYDATGKLVLNNQLNSSFEKANISTLEPGIYLVKITNANSFITKTISIVR